MYFNVSFSDEDDCWIRAAVLCHWAAHGGRPLTLTLVLGDDHDDEICHQAPSIIVSRGIIPSAVILQTYIDSWFHNLDGQWSYLTRIWSEKCKDQVLLSESFMIKEILSVSQLSSVLLKLREQILLLMIYLDCPGSIEKEVCALWNVRHLSPKKKQIMEEPY